MPVTLNFKSYDAYFRSTEGDKIILNDVSYFAMNDLDMVGQQLSTIYGKTDVISTIPTCDCGELRGGYLVGVVCSKCGTTCKDVYDKIEPVLWMKAFSEDTKFMNPHFWIMLENVISTGKFKGLRWLCDSTYNPNLIIKPIIYEIYALIGNKRIYSNTIKHIPEILDFVKENDPRYKKSLTEKRKIDLIKDLYFKNQDKIFSTYLPIVNKKLFVMERTNKGTFVNLSMSYMVSAVRSWIKHSSNTRTTELRKNIITATVVYKLSCLYEQIYTEFVIKKQGIIRKHNYGARSDFTFRAVITSIMGKHQHNEVHVPWCIGVTAFRPHLMNMLVNRKGYTCKQASHKLLDAIYNYDEEISELLDTLLIEAPDGKLWVNMQRNPSLLQGSCLKVYIGKFKKSPEDKTIAISPLVVTPMNADYKKYYRLAYHLTFPPTSFKQNHI